MTDEDLALLQQRYHGVLEQIAQCRGGSESGAPVTLIAASKFQPVEALIALYDLGHRDFGENYLQELQHKQAALACTGRSPRWHLVGALQSNKARAAAASGAMVHGVDSLALARKLARGRPEGAPPVHVLMQVRLSAGQARAGVAPERALGIAAELIGVAQLKLCGLMGLPGQNEPPRPAFALLRQLRDQVRALPGAAGCQELSMGMSQSFREAIAEGATMVRVGTALFGPRKSPTTDA